MLKNPNLDLGISGIYIAWEGEAGVLQILFYISPPKCTQFMKLGAFIFAENPAISIPKLLKMHRKTWAHTRIGWGGPTSRGENKLRKSKISVNKVTAHRANRVCIECFVCVKFVA